jgi:hypothetical protein
MFIYHLGYSLAQSKGPPQLAALSGVALFLFQKRNVGFKPFEQTLRVFQADDGRHHNAIAI